MGPKRDAARLDATTEAAARHGEKWLQVQSLPMLITEKLENVVGLHKTIYKISLNAGRFADV